MYIYGPNGYNSVDEDGVETNEYGTPTGRTVDSDGRIYDYRGRYTSYIGSDGIVRDTTGKMTGEKDYK